jgi:diadenosine tetraphosphate (Ap4A) HIT family hydrolase
MDATDEKLSAGNSHYIYETGHWAIYLSSIQSYLGRCEIVAKGNYSDLSGLDQEVWLDFLAVVRQLETAIRKSFGATMFNWACLMNNAYQTKPPHPFVHWHCIPRYDHEVKFDGHMFTDPEFGHHYDPDIIEDDDPRIVAATTGLKNRIITRIRENI